MSKAVAKRAPAKKAAAKAPKATKKAGVKTKAILDRAAEVESNIGGSQSLRDFLAACDWN